ncbi:MAG: hypothetical protein JXQ67_06075 [Campylobacterales bacterium]|nr:hypothetical protein [Campylobacterales bacterium]
MKLETLYKKYYDLYTKTNFIFMNNKYVKKFTKLYLYMAFLFYTLGSSIFAFPDYYLLGNIGNMINGICFIILAVLFYQKYQKEFNEKFIKFHNLEGFKKEDIDYIFYDVYSCIKKDSDFIENKHFLKSFSELEINKMSFLNNPFVLVIISIIVTMIGGYTVVKIDLITLINISAILIISLLVYYFINLKNKHFGRNKHASFKLFLIKIEYYEQNNNANKM